MVMPDGGDGCLRVLGANDGAFSIHVRVGEVVEIDESSAWRRREVPSGKVMKSGCRRMRRRGRSSGVRRGPRRCGRESASRQE